MNLLNFAKVEEVEISVFDFNAIIQVWSDTGSKVEAIKTMRARLGCSLLEAKIFCDRWDNIMKGCLAISLSEPTHTLGDLLRAKNTRS